METYVVTARGCAVMVGKDHAAIGVMLDWLESTATALAGSNAAGTMPMTTQRTVGSILSIVTAVGKVAVGELMKASTTPPANGKAGKDVAVVLVGLVEAVKTGVSGSPQGEVLVKGLKALRVVTEEETGRRRVLGRKKVAERVAAVLEEVEKGKTGRRGKGMDKEREEVVMILKERFEV